MIPEAAETAVSDVAPESAERISSRYRCMRCGVESDPDASFCIGCGKMLDEADRQNFILAAQATSQSRDPEFVYPHIPPLSPHFCWINVLAVGLSQVLFGQVKKGVIIFGIAIVLGFITGGFLYLVCMVLAVIDAFRVGRALKDGRAVRKMQFFPK